MTRHPLNRGERGAAVIEASLVLMVFLVLVFSLFDFGFVLYVHHTLMHQARSGARYGAVLEFDAAATTAITNMVLYDSPDAGTRTTGVLGLTAANVSVQRQGEGTNEDRILVTITGFKYPLITPGMAGIHNGQDISVSMPYENRE
jgi:Flp pilus assembly protein TadG